METEKETEKKKQPTAWRPDRWIPEMHFPPQMRPSTIDRKLALMQRIVDYAYARCSEKLPLEEVAEYCGCSVATITQMFQKYTDTSFLEVLTRCRMEAADELIHQGVPLEEVSKQISYRSHSSFCRQFKSNSGIPARTYRKTLEKEEEKQEPEAQKTED